MAVEQFSAATSPPAALQVTPWRAAGMLAWREIIRFLRQRNRVIGAVGQPVLFWLLFGAGLNQTFRLEAGSGGPSFAEYYFPGTLVLIVLFTAIFATISVIEDRREGFLQSVLVAPIPRWSMVLGKVIGGSLLALGQALLFLCLAITIPMELSVAAVAAIVALLLVIAVGLTSLGLVIAWRMESTQGFHAVMSLLLMPMWLLSGAFFPVPTPAADAPLASFALHWLMRLNPLTYGLAALRRLMSGPPPAGLWMPGAATAWTVTLLFAVGAFIAAWRIARRTTSGDLL